MAASEDKEANNDHSRAAMQVQPCSFFQPFREFGRFNCCQALSRDLVHLRGQTSGNRFQNTDLLRLGIARCALLVATYVANSTYDNRPPTDWFHEETTTSGTNRLIVI